MGVRGGGKGGHGGALSINPSNPNEGGGWDQHQTNKETNKRRRHQRNQTHTHLYQRQHLGKQKPQQALALNKSVQSVKNARPHDEEVSVQCSRVGSEGLGQCFPWRGRRTPSGLPRSGGRWLRCTRTPRKRRNRWVTKRPRPTNLSLSLSLFCV